MELYDSIQITETKKTPYSPLQKSPYIKIKLECKNLDKAIINVNNLNINDLTKIQGITHNINLLPYAMVTLNGIEHKTEISKSNSPQWDTKIKYEVKDPKVDNILIVVNTKGITGYNQDLDDFTFNKDSDNFVGFQLIPIIYLEKGGFVGKTESMWFRLITTKPDDYFNNDIISKHDPEHYSRTVKQAEKESMII
jgi:hypothetical protein